MSKYVCIAEDNDDLRMIFEMTFTSMGFTVHAVEDGRQALQVLEEIVPDVLVLDVNMPHVTGLEVVRRVANDQRMRDTKIVLVTGNPQALLGPEGDYADLCLVKPVDPIELGHLVKRLVQGPSPINSRL